jgi:hypothetical protein
MDEPTAGAYDEESDLVIRVEGARVASNPSSFPTVHDPELDAPRTEARRPQGPVHLPQETMRLLANPFLTVSLFFFGLWSAVVAERYKNIHILLLGVIVVFTSVGFLHYHCLDCGTTGFLFRWRRHECERVLVRRINGQVRRWRGPNPTAQTILWGYALLIVSILAGIAWRFAHLDL